MFTRVGTKATIDGALLQIAEIPGTTCNSVWRDAGAIEVTPSNEDRSRLGYGGARIYGTIGSKEVVVIAVNAV